MNSAREVNFDGLIGPTHNYAGLAQGNLASQRSRAMVAHPRAAALQGLEKMRVLMELGVPQAVLPPQERPDLAFLRRIGFTGDDRTILARAAQDAPDLLTAACSASSMWAANAATVSPSADTADGRLHLTPANLVSHMHRSLEAPGTGALLQHVFPDPRLFAVHSALPAMADLADEGAANHLRLGATPGSPALEAFVHGRLPGETAPATSKFAARQSHAASAAIARLHGLNPDRVLFVRQNPAAIDAGVFHNDVIAVANENVLLCHAEAFEEQDRILAELAEHFAQACGGESKLSVIQISPSLLSLQQAVDSYLFNSQIVTLADSTMALVAPVECREMEAARRAVDYILAADTRVRQVVYVDVRQSMHNGGGPACLRLRVVLTEEQRRACHQGVFLTSTLCEQLHAWIERRYRSDLAPADLADPTLARESHDALDELARLLSLGRIYAFQN